jgi:hypothetical protein
MSLIDKDGKEGNPHINLKSIIDLSHSNMKRRKLSLKKILETLELTAHSTMVESELDITREYLKSLTYLMRISRS